MHLIAARPEGTPVTELRIAANMSWSAFHYHLAVLERAGHVKTLRVGRLNFVCTADATPDGNAAYLRSPQAKRIALTIVESPGTSVREVAGRTGIPSRTVYYHVRRMRRVGLLVAGSSLDHRDLRAAPELLDALTRT